MRIAIFCPNYPPASQEGGISHYTQRLAHNIQDIGQRVFIVTGDDYSGNGTDGDIRVMQYPGNWGRQTIRKMASELKSHGIDLVNLQYSPPMYPLSFKMAWPYMTKQFTSSVSFHTLWGGSKLNYLTGVTLLRSAHAVIATNSEITYLLRRYLPFFLRKTYFIPIGANIEPREDHGSMDSLAAKYGLDLKIPILAFFGMMYYGKGMKLLFETARHLRQRHNIDFQLVIIGGGISDDPVYHQELERLALKLEIKDRVLWTGQIPAPEVSAILSLSVLVLLPFASGASDRRGSLLAALAHGKPIVTTRPLIPIPLFRNGANMLWPGTNTSEALAELTLEVLQNNRLRQELSRGALDLANRSAWPLIARETVACFRKELKKA